MSDKDEGARVRAFLEDAREKLKPAVERMADASREVYTAAATIAGDPITPENKAFWQITGNLFHAANGKLDPAGPEIAALVKLSKAIAVTSNLDDWAPSAAVCDRLFDTMDGGEELGLSDYFLGVDWQDEMQRDVALRKGMQFHRVPRSYQSAIAAVVTDLMLAMPQTWNCDGSQLSQPWASACTYVIFAIAERVKGDTTIH